MKKAAPFTWIVKFTVHPMWVQDGFYLSDERALSMLEEELGHASSDELAAEVLEAPSPLQICRMQGYDAKHAEAGRVVREIKDSTPNAGVVREALIKSRDFVNSVALTSGDDGKAQILTQIYAALQAIDCRQGDEVEIEE